MASGMKYIAEINPSGQPARFAIKTDEAVYRMFSYFRIGNDSSIAMQSYYKSNYIATENIQMPLEELVIQKPYFSLAEMSKSKQYFKIHKSSFHKSGVLNIKDKENKRMIGDTDIISIPFGKIEDNIRLFYIYPTHYSKYPMLSENSNKPHFIIKLPASNKNMPAMFEVRLSKYNFDLPAKLDEAYDSFAGFCDHETLLEYELDIYTIFRKAPNPSIPNTEALFREYYFTPGE